MVFIVHLRGLPFSAGPEEIMNFLEGCNIEGGIDGVHITYNSDGRVSGEAFVELDGEQDLEAALRKDKEHMGKRYIDINEASRQDMDFSLRRGRMSTSNQNSPECVVKLQGLPFQVSKEEVAHFFTGMKIKPNGITLLENDFGRCTGDAFVEFSSADVLDEALAKHRDKIGHRYIEVYKSSKHQVQMTMNRRGGGGFNQNPDMGMGGDMGNRGMRGMGGGGGMGGGNMGNMGGGMGGGNMGSGGMGMRGMGMGGGGGMGMDNMGGMGGNMGGMGMGGGNFGMGMGGGGNMGMGMGGGNMANMMGNRPGPYDRSGGNMGNMGNPGIGFRSGRGNLKGGTYRRGGGSGGGGKRDGNCVIRMRGMPFKADEEAVKEFFKPLVPETINVVKLSDGRASGKGEVEFSSHQEAKMAMTRNNDRMEYRYIELFLDCEHEDDCEQDNQRPSQRGGGRMSSRGGYHGEGQMRGGGPDDGYNSGYSMGSGGMESSGVMVGGGSSMGSGVRHGGGGYSEDMSGGMGYNTGYGGGSVSGGSNSNMGDSMDDYSGMGYSGKSNSARMTTKMLDAMTLGQKNIGDSYGGGGYSSDLTGSSGNGMGGSGNMKMGGFF